MPDSEEPVGTLAEEAARLLAAVVTGGTQAVPEDAKDHACPHGWCPLCQAAGYLQEHPEVVAQVLVAGAELLKVVRDAVDKATGPREDRE